MVFLGKSDYESDGCTEKLNTTSWFLFFWMPLIPRASYRLERPLGAKFTGNYSFTIIDKYPRNWSQIGKTLLKFWAGFWGVISLINLLSRL